VSSDQPAFSLEHRPNPDGRIEHHSGTVRKESPACPRKDIEEGEAKFETAALVPRRESQFEMATAT